MKPFIHLFWKMQMDILYACPPLRGVVGKFSLGAAGSRKVWLKTLLLLILHTPGAVFIHFRNLLKKRVVLPHLSVPVTTRCTLNCDKCFGHIPDLEHPSDFPAHELIQSLQTLLACVNYVYTVAINGGEPFLHSDIGKIVQACANSNKVKNINIQSNGTVIPDENTLTELRNAKATVQISRYSRELQPNVETLKRILRSNDIRFTHASAEHWKDVGVLGQLQPGSGKERFSVCVQRFCPLIWSGKFYSCPSAALTEELFSACVITKEDYIDLRTISSEEFRNQYRKLRKKRVLAACDYCCGYTYMTPKIPVAVQRSSLIER